MIEQFPYKLLTHYSFSISTHLGLWMGTKFQLIKTIWINHFLIVQNCMPVSTLININNNWLRGVGGFQANDMIYKQKYIWARMIVGNVWTFTLNSRHLHMQRFQLSLSTKEKGGSRRGVCTHEHHRHELLGKSRVMLLWKKNCRYAPLRWHFLHSEIRVNGK